MARKGSSGFRLEGTDDLLAGLSYSESSVGVAAVNALKTGAAMLRQRAHDYAPLDEGDLESSIKIVKQRLGKVAAANGTMEIEVGVDGSVQKKSREGVTVGDYAGRMESGTYNLGRKSEDKNEEMSAFYARDLGGADAVGPGFFSRAVDDAEPYIYKVLSERVAAAMRKANARKSGRKTTARQR